MITLHPLKTWKAFFSYVMFLDQNVNTYNRNKVKNKIVINCWRRHFLVKTELRVDAHRAIWVTVTASVKLFLIIQQI